MAPSYSTLLESRFIGQHPLNGCGQARQMGLGDVPHYGRLNAMILVPENVSDPGDLCPRHTRMSRFASLGDSSASFRDYLQATFNRALHRPAASEGLKVGAD